MSLLFLTFVSAQPSQKGGLLNLTQQEQQELSQWKSISEIRDKAHQGDPVALYMLGIAYSIGTKSTKPNLKMAKDYFIASASLGYVPSIEEIRGMYTHKTNIGLVLVYARLAILLGHEEYLPLYEKGISIIQKKYGSEQGSILKDEIEKIALIKLGKITKNLFELEKSENKGQFVKELFSNKSITLDDQGNLKF